MGRWRRPYRCSWCRERGHNRRTCPTIARAVEENPTGYVARDDQIRKSAYQSNTKRTCGYCNSPGHNRRTCTKIDADAAQARHALVEKRKASLRFAKEAGLGVGALVRSAHNVRGVKKEVLWMVTGIAWDKITHTLNGYAVRLEAVAETNNYGAPLCRGAPLNSANWISSREWEQAPLEQPSWYFNVAEPADAKYVGINVPKDWYTNFESVDQAFANIRAGGRRY